MNEPELASAKPSRPAGAATRAALLAATAISLSALALRLLSWRSVPATLLTVTAVLGVGFGCAHLALRGALEARRRHVAALTLLGFVPLLAVEARRALGEPLAAGSELEALVGAVALALPCFAAIGALAWHAAAERQQGLESFVRGAAMVSAAACVALVAAGWAHVPQSEAPRLAELPPLDDGSEGYVEQRADRRGDASIELGRSCIGGSCFALVRSGTAVRSIGPRFSRAARVELYAPDEGHLLLAANGHAIAVAPTALSDGSRWTTPTASLAARTALPLSFVALAMLGVAAAVLGMARRYHLGRRLRALAGAGEGWVLDNGWLAADDGSIEPVRGVAPGPVLVERGERPSQRAYRGASAERWLRLHPGTRDQLIERLRTELTGVDAWLFGWIVPLATPLLVALALALLS